MDDWSLVDKAESKLGNRCLLYWYLATISKNKCILTSYFTTHNHYIASARLSASHSRRVNASLSAHLRMKSNAGITLITTMFKFLDEYHSDTSRVIGVYLYLPLLHLPPSLRHTTQTLTLTVSSKSNHSSKALQSALLPQNKIYKMSPIQFPTEYSYCSFDASMSEDPSIKAAIAATQAMPSRTPTGTSAQATATGEQNTGAGEINAGIKSQHRRSHQHNPSSHRQRNFCEFLSTPEQRTLRLTNRHVAVIQYMHHTQHHTETHITDYMTRESPKLRGGGEIDEETREEAVRGVVKQQYSTLGTQTCF